MRWKRDKYTIPKMRWTEMKWSILWIRWNRDEMKHTMNEMKLRWNKAHYKWDESEINIPYQKWDETEMKWSILWIRWNRDGIKHTMNEMKPRWNKAHYIYMRCWNSTNCLSLVVVQREWFPRFLYPSKWCKRSSQMGWSLEVRHYFVPCTVPPFVVEDIRKIALLIM